MAYARPDLGFTVAALAQPLGALGEVDVAGGYPYVIVTWMAPAGWSPSSPPDLEIRTAVSPDQWRSCDGVAGSADGNGVWWKSIAHTSNQGASAPMSFFFAVDTGSSGDVRGARLRFNAHDVGNVQEVLMRTDAGGGGGGDEPVYPGPSIEVAHGPVGAMRFRHVRQR